MSSNTLNNIGLAGLASYFALRGSPLIKRELGQAEVPRNVGVDTMRDSSWPLRPYHPTELTTAPLRVTEKGLKEKDKVSIDDSKSDEVCVDVIVVGGAAAGMSAAACIQHEGMSCIVLEKNESVGDIWRSRYHRLNLHDIIEECHLPFFDMPKSYPVFPSRQQFAQYLEAYKVGMNLNVLTLHPVFNITQAPEGDKYKWIVKAKNLRLKEGEPGYVRSFKCHNLVIANGIYNDPIIPKVPGLGNQTEKPLYKGLSIHSSRFTNGKDLGLTGKNVLVVGWGNSGCEIAVDLCENGAKTTLLARSPQCIAPRWVFQRLESMLHTHVAVMKNIPFAWLLALPAAVMAEVGSLAAMRYQYGNDLSDTGLPLSPFGPILYTVTSRNVPVMDIGTIQCIRDGRLKVTQKGIKAMYEDGVIFEDGSKEQYDAVIWSTGYEMASGHKHIFDKELVKKIGINGKESLIEKMLLPGTEHPDVPHLFHLFGRLQMIRDAAPGMARAILKKTPNKIDLHPPTFNETWSWFIAKHALTAGVYYQWRQTTKSKL